MRSRRTYLGERGRWTFLSESRRREFVKGRGEGRMLV